MMSAGDKRRMGLANIPAPALTNSAGAFFAHAAGGSVNAEITEAGSRGREGGGLHHRFRQRLHRCNALTQLSARANTHKMRMVNKFFAIADTIQADKCISLAFILFTR